MRRPIRVSGFAGTMAVAVAVISAKAQLGDLPPKIEAVTRPRTPTTAPPAAVTAATTPASLLGGERAPTGQVLHPEVEQAATVATAPTVPAGPRTIRGDSIATGYGPMEVAIVLDGTRITDVITVEFPDDDAESVEINLDALPKLRQQILDAQGSDIQGVTGATYTAIGYALSVQSALDRA